MSWLKTNEEFWDRFSASRGPWSQGADKELIRKARDGRPQIFITTKKLVPLNWFPTELSKCKVLGLASGGGQQMPILAATGAKITCVELSQEQIDRDLEVCSREELTMEHIKGDIGDLSMLSEDSFDLAINPVSLCYIQDPLKVFQECFRVLKPGGVFFCGFDNPVGHAVAGDHDLRLVHRIPCNNLNKVGSQQESIEFGHSLSTILGGILSSGFVITDFYEDIWGEGFDMAIDEIMPQFIAVRALKGVSL